MKNITKLLLGCVAIASLTVSASASITLSLTPTSQTVDQGGTASYDIDISGLKGSSDYNGPALGGFVLQLDFDSSIASAQAVTFGSSLNLSGADSQYSDLGTTGQVYIAETSYDTAAALEAAQGNSFTLATVTFTGLQAGSTAIAFDSLTSLSDENANTLDLISATGGSFTVAAIPEPASTACIVGALALGVCVLRRRYPRSSNSQS